MSGCADEERTHHYRGRWFGFGPVRDDEYVIFAVFEKTKHSLRHVTAESFENRSLVQKSQSLARASYVTRTLFDQYIAPGNDPAKGPLVGIARGHVSAFRALRADININSVTTNVRSICILDLVEEGDCDGHATIGYSKGTFAEGMSQGQIGRIRSRIRMDLANEFSEIISANENHWPWRGSILPKRVVSIAREVTRAFSRVLR